MLFDSCSNSTDFYSYCDNGYQQEHKANEENVAIVIQIVTVETKIYNCSR